MAKVLIGFVALVGALAIAAYANYERNAPLDADLQERPYQSLSDEDLKALLDAYKGQVTGLQAKLGSYSGDRTKVMDGFAPSDFDSKVKAFDRFQRSNSAWRDVNRNRIENQLEVEKLEKEQGIRAQGLHEERTRILRRVLTF